MTPDEPAPPLTIDRRRAIFRAVVEAQDAGATVDASRVAVGQRYQVTVSQVRAVEREGLTKEWPPL